MQTRTFCLLALALLATGCSSAGDVLQAISSKIKPEPTSAPGTTAPYLYVSTFDYGTNLNQCLDGAQGALKNHGFTANFSREQKSKSGYVGADNPNGNVAAVIKCYIDKNGSGATFLAVSGHDNDKVYPLYSSLHDAEW